ncbi:MAG: MarR family transcriptional regulator [Bacteroidales bacterium]|nr:MarR family transcriptional regulator [Bacteroidales bacterium]
MERLCKIRDIYTAIEKFEVGFEKEYELSLNEGMLLCTLLEVKTLSSTELAKKLGLTCSNTSKVIKSIEGQNFIERSLGKEDKRQMYFKLTKEGEEKIRAVKTSKVNIPEDLKPLLG